MIRLLLFLCFVGTTWAMPKTYQKIDPAYDLFHFSASMSVHSDESLALVYEAPHGSIYNGGIWGHEERLELDLRRIKVDWLVLHHVPITFGMSYRTYPKDPYADSFQINRVETAFITPRWHGFTAEYEIHALSNSGRQGVASYWRAYFQTTGISPVFSMMIAYVQTNGLGWIARTPAARGLDCTKMDWGQLFGTGLFWSPSKGWIGDITLDLQMLGINDYLSYRVEHYWNDDPTQPAQYGKNNWRQEVSYGNTYVISQDLRCLLSASIGFLDDVFIFGGSFNLILSTSFD